MDGLVSRAWSWMGVRVPALDPGEIVGVILVLPMRLLRFTKFAQQFVVL